MLSVGHAVVQQPLPGGICDITARRMVQCALAAVQLHNPCCAAFIHTVLSPLSVPCSFLLMTLMLTFSPTCTLLASRLCMGLRAQSWRTKHWCRSTWVSTPHSTAQQHCTVPCNSAARSGYSDSAATLLQSVSHTVCLPPCHCSACAFAALQAGLSWPVGAKLSNLLSVAVFGTNLIMCGCCCAGACEALAGQPGQSVTGQTLYMVLPRAPLESLHDLVDDAHRMMAVIELGGEPMGRSLTAGCTLLLEAIWRDRYGDSLLWGGWELQGRGVLC
jgi:hypothetical protein